MTMNVKEAFQRSLVTWKSWVIQNLDPRKNLGLLPKLLTCALQVCMLILHQETKVM